MNNENIIIKNIASSIGGGSSTSLYISIDVEDGKSQVVIEHTIVERHDIKDFHRIKALFEKIANPPRKRDVHIEEIHKLQTTLCNT